MKTQSQIARDIAIKAHAGQFRRDGVTPYHTHPEAVAEELFLNGESDETVAAGWLHDVLEDCPEWSAERLSGMGISPAVTRAVSVLTKDLEDGYMEYIERIKGNKIAKVVKVQDILHNLCSNPKPENVAKYARALVCLLS